MFDSVMREAKNLFIRFVDGEFITQDEQRGVCVTWPPLVNTCNIIYSRSAAWKHLDWLYSCGFLISESPTNTTSYFVSGTGCLVDLQGNPRSNRCLWNPKLYILRPIRVVSVIWNNWSCTWCNNVQLISVGYSQPLQDVLLSTLYGALERLS